MDHRATELASANFRTALPSLRRPENVESMFVDGHQ